MCRRDRGDLAVGKRDRVPFRPRVPGEAGIDRRGLLVEGQDARAEEVRDKPCQRRVESASAPSGGEELDADEQLRKTCRREKDLSP